MSIATSRARRNQSNKSYADEPSPPPSPQSSTSDDDVSEDDDELFIKQHNQNCAKCNVAGVPVKYHSDTKGDLKCCFSCSVVICLDCMPVDPGSNWRCEQCVEQGLQVLPQFLDVTEKELSEYELKNQKAREKNSAFWQKLSSSTTAKTPKVAKPKSDDQDDEEEDEEFDPNDDQDDEEFDTNQGSDDSDNEDLDPSLLKAAVEKLNQDENSSNTVEARKLLPSKFAKTKKLVYKGIVNAKGLSNQRVMGARKWEEYFKQLEEYKVRRSFI